MTQNNALLIYNLVSAKKQIRNAHTDGTNPYHSSKYATLESVIQAVTEPLLSHGIVWQQVSHDCDTGARIETILHGHGGELSSGIVHVPADKQSAHAFGSALTYARRYSLTLAVGIGADDDDGNAAQDEPPKAVVTKHSEPYHIYITDTSSKVVQSVDDFLNGYRAATKDENGDMLISDLLTDLANRNYAGLKRALDETRNDSSISGSKQTRRINFLEEHLGYADASQE
jgi:hypothetical protein